MRIPKAIVRISIGLIAIYMLTMGLVAIIKTAVDSHEIKCRVTRCVTIDG